MSQSPDLSARATWRTEEPDFDIMGLLFASWWRDVCEMQGGLMGSGNKVLVAGLLVGLIGCSTEETVYVDNMDTEAKAALATAVRHAGFELADVKVTKLELDREPASSVYEVEFKKGWYEYEFDVDAKSGRVLKMKKEFDW